MISRMVPETSRDLGNGRSVVEKRRITQDGKRIEKDIRITHQDETRECLESVRMYTYDEMAGMFCRTGFIIKDVFGNYEGSEFSKESPRLILVGWKGR